MSPLQRSKALFREMQEWDALTWAWAFNAFLACGVLLPLSIALLIYVCCL